MAGPPKDEKKPWPLSWILIIVLTYILLQTAYFILFAEG